MTKRLLRQLFCACMAFLLFVPVCAHAEETGSITVTYPVEDVRFTLYRIGENDQNGGYILDEAFAGYAVDLKEKTAASLLAEYAVRDEIAPAASAVTSVFEDGIAAVFEDLPKGVYLLTGERITVENTEYIPSDVLVELPMWNTEKELVWDAQIVDKYTTEEIYSPSFTELSVVKIWKNDTKKTRPEEISVQLLKDGKVEEEVTLNEANDWRYAWKELDDSYTWSVVEKTVPKGYTVGRTSEGTVIFLTNTTTPPVIPPPPVVPPTGQLWWPVPLLLLAGGVFLLIGTGRRRKA